MTASLIAFTALTAFLTGCSGNSPSQTSEKQVRVSTAPLDTAVVGKWWNGTNGYIFGDNRKVSLVMDFSSMNINFTEDGQFNKAGYIIDKDNITYDGKNLVVYYDNGEDVSIVVNLERRDEENPDSFDGYYSLYGGLVTEYIIQSVGLSIDNLINDESITLSAEVDGESFIVTLENFCEYETLNGSSLEMFSKYMSYMDSNADCVKYDYKVEGDTLTLTYSGEEFVETYERVKE